MKITATKIGLLTAASMTLVMCFSYYTQNGLWLPQPILIRWEPEVCPTIWRPKDLGSFGPRQNATKLYEGGGCLSSSGDPDSQTKASFQRVLHNFKVESSKAEKEISVPEQSRLSFEKMAKENFPVRFQPLDMTRGYVVSAFLDRRVGGTPDVKILYIVPFSSPDLYCQTFCGDTYIAVKGRPMFLPYFTQAHRNCVWQSYLLHCLFPPECEVETVSVSSMPCLTPTNAIKVINIDATFKPPITFAVCVNQVFNMKKEHLPKLVRFIEAFRLIGGEKIYTYGMHNVDQHIKDAISHYEKQGIIKFYDWTIPHDVSSIFYFGQVLQNMDCLYRHMSDTSYLFYIDLDEIFIPIKHDNLTHLFQALTQDKVFRYESGYHFPRVKVAPKKLSQSWDVTDYSGLCVEPQPKPLLRPRNMVQIGVHYMDQPLRPYSFGRYFDVDLGFAVHLGKPNCNNLKEIHLPNEVEDTLLKKLKQINVLTMDVLKTM